MARRGPGPGSKGGGVNITLLQLDPTRGRAPARIHALLERVERAAGERGGVVVLPEIWSGGFTYPAVRRLSRYTPWILERLRAVSARTRSVIVGSLPEERGGRLYNSAAVVDSGRIRGRCYKQRLFAPMKEDRHFAVRPTRRRFATSLGVIAVMICFDLRFPELCRGLRESDAWLLLVPAQWPEPRCPHWETLLAARAVENQIFVAGCNRAGTSGPTRFCGRSQVVDPWGRLLVRAGGRTAALTVTVDPLEAARVRQRLPMGPSDTGPA